MNPGPDSTHYELLGVPHDATCHQVAQLRRTLSRRFHTDNGAEPNGELMARINHAIDVLGDRDKRRKYDDTLWEHGHREARAEADRLREARAKEIRAEDVEAFAAALEGDRPTRIASVAPPLSARGGNPQVEVAPVITGHPQQSSGLRPWQAVARGRGPAPLRRRSTRG